MQIERCEPCHAEDHAQCGFMTEDCGCDCHPTDSCDKCGKTTSLGFFSESWLEGIFCTNCFERTLVEIIKNRSDKATAFLATLRVTCTNDGHKECEGCPGFGFSPNTGAACGAVYMAPKP